MRAATTLLALLFCAAPAVAGTASVYYFDHSYRISFDFSSAVYGIAASSPALKMETITTRITYTNGAKFLLDGPEDLTAQELGATTSYRLLGETEALEGGTSLLLLPPGTADAFAPAVEEAMRPYFSTERGPARLLEGVSPAGITFKALELPGRAEKPLWEPTLKMDHVLSDDRHSLVFTVIPVPMGLNGINREMVERAADKRSAVMLSVGAGGNLAGVVLKAGPGRTLAYMAAAGADIAALESEDLKNFWQWSREGSLNISTSAPEFVCTNLKVSDPELAKLIKPYALRRIGGADVAFISLVPSRSPAAADLAGGPFEITEPRDEKALNAVISELRGRLKVKAIVAVSFLNKDELGWLLGARGIDVLIGPKSWDIESARRTRVELRKWDKESHTGPALTVFPDAGGSGAIKLDFGPRGALSALEAAPPPDDAREPLLYREQLYMKERIVRYFLGSGDSLLPDLRSVGADYTIPSFFGLAASLTRKACGAEAAVLRAKPFFSRVLGDIPTAMVKAWLGPDEPLVLALVPGRYLEEISRKAPPELAPGTDPQLAYSGAEYFAVSGLDASGRLAGLPINQSETYLVAMPAALAAGKPFIKVLKRRPGTPDTLYAAVVGGLEKIKARTFSRQAWEGAVSGEMSNYAPPHSVWRLNLRNLSAQMTNTGVRAPAGYGDTGESRLSAVDQTQMQGSCRLFSEYYSEKFRFDAGVSADYGKTVLRPKGQPKVTTESVDQLTYSGELVYRMKKFDGKLGRLVVGPYASAAYDTEFYHAPDQPLRQVLRGGAGFKLFEGAALQEFYAGLSTEQVYTYLPARTKFALETGFRATIPIPRTALRLNADGTYRNFARSRFDTVYDLKERLELNFKVSTRLYGDVMISPFVNYFLASGKKLHGSGYNVTTGFMLEYSRLFKLKR